MKKIFLLILFLISFNISAVFAVQSDKNSDIILKNRLFSVTLPKEFKGDFVSKISKDRISVYHKASMKAGFGGFAFGIKAYKNPSDHAVLPGSRKLGELTDKKGVLYDIVLKHPTDVQYDYTKSPEPPKAFAKIYDYGDNPDIKGVNGSIYFKNQGIKGDDLYGDILKKHIRAIKEKWDSNKLETENMSYMYNVISKAKKNPLNKIGYVYYDLNADGIDELLIGEIADGIWKGVVYDIYTMVNREPKHVISGGSRDRYYACDGTFVCNEYSVGANESGVRVYNLVENSTELFPQVSFKYDGYKNSKQPWFLSYGDFDDDGDWENVTEKTFNERKEVFEKYERFDYIPFSKFKSDDNLKKSKLTDKYNGEKDYFDYSVVLSDFPKSYYYTTVKIGKSNERILIITDKITDEKTSDHGLFYYFKKNGFVYSLGYLESEKPFALSKNYLYLNDKDGVKKFYISDKKFEVVKIKGKLFENDVRNIEFETIKSADKFAGDFGEPAGDDVVRAKVEGFYFDYHRPQYKKKYIKDLMKECIKDGVKTQVQMYCQMVKKLHP